MKIIKPTSMVALPIIVEGTIYSDILRDFKLSQTWLEEQLSNQGVNELKNVFFASINRDLELHVSLKDEHNVIIPQIKH